jgi:hypothetical protein
MSSILVIAAGGLGPFVQMLGALSAPAGTYSSITATFANPQMEIYNNTAAPITVGTTVCAVKTACKLTPALNPATTTVSTAPFPITLAASSPLGFLLHFDVNNHIDSAIEHLLTTHLNVAIPIFWGVRH